MSTLALEEKSSNTNNVHQIELYSSMFDRFVLSIEILLPSYLLTFLLATAAATVRTHIGRSRLRFTGRVHQVVRS